MELHKKHTIFNNGHRRRQCVFYVCLIAIPLVQFILMYVCVNFRSILFAFQKYDYETADYAFNFTYFAQNFKTITSELFKGELLGRAWWNSIKSYLVTLLIILPLQIFVAFFVYKKFPLAGYFRIVLYLPSMVAGMTTIIGFKYFVEKGLPMLFPNIKKLTEFGGLLANDSTIFNTLLFYVAWTSLRLLCNTTFSRWLSAPRRRPRTIPKRRWAEFCSRWLPRLLSFSSNGYLRKKTRIIRGG